LVSHPRALSGVQNLQVLIGNTASGLVNYICRATGRGYENG